MSLDLTKLSFYSRRNYMKRGNTIYGSSTINFTGTADEIKTVTITHNLGYVPNYVVAAQLTDTTTLWSSNRAQKNVSFGSGVAEALFYYWATTTTLVIKVQNKSSSPYSGSRKVYWAIYLDYGTL